MRVAKGIVNDTSRVVNMKKLPKTFHMTPIKIEKEHEHGWHTYLGQRVSCSAMPQSHLSCVSILSRYGIQHVRSQLAHLESHVSHHEN